MLMSKPPKREWRDGVYLTTVENTLDADILESKLRGEGIPCLRNFRSASNAMEIIMGKNFSFPIDIYVPESALEDAQNILVAFSEEELEPLTDEELERQALAAVEEDD